jgi:Transposase DDE domain group 1
VLRADSGFAREARMAWCEGNRVDYVLGLARNERLVGAITAAPAAAEVESRASGGTARRFADFPRSTPLEHAGELEPVAARRRQGRAPAQGGQPAPRRHLAHGR